MPMPNKDRFWELCRFGLNGLAATGIHFLVLTLNIKILGIPSAGVANFIAACFGISASFLGNRFFVFPQNKEGFFGQLSRFLVLYAVLAGFQGLFLFFWTDFWKLDYRIGFIVATCIQMCLSYIGNKKVVFRHESS